MMVESKKLSGRLLFLIMVVAFASSVCTAQMSTAGMPQIKIIEPKEGAQIPAGDVTVMVDVTNFGLVNKLGQANIAGEGHLHYYIDVAVPKTPGKPAVTAAGTFAPTANTIWTWPNVKPGKHNFSVELVNNDHAPVIPVIYKSVNVTVTVPTLKTMSANSVTISLVAKNMSFNPTKITVPAGDNVTVNFDNRDQYIPHNFAVYTDALAKTAIFQGVPIVGPAKVNYSFTAPSKAGTYFFRCDVHPTIMTGQFIVQ